MSRCNESASNLFSSLLIKLAHLFRYLCRYRLFNISSDMPPYNRFDALLDSLVETRGAHQEIRDKIVEGASELGKAKKVYVAKDKLIVDGRAEVAKLKQSNRELKVSMVLSLIERDELEAKKKELQLRIQKIKKDIDELDNQTDHSLKSVEASHQPQQPPYNSKS